MTGQKQIVKETECSAAESICWDCRRPVRDCRFLLQRRPYRGAVYKLVTRGSESDGHKKYKAVLMERCPHHC